jgi:hypothetical protein
VAFHQFYKFLNSRSVSAAGVNRNLQFAGFDVKRGLSGSAACEQNDEIYEILLIADRF